MRVSKKERNGVITVSITGSLESGTSSFFASEINRVIADASNTIILDFADLEYVSSAGLQVLLTTQQTCKVKNIKLKIINANGVVMEVLESTGFDKIIEVNK